jgi:hypothetical protein
METIEQLEFLKGEFEFLIKSIQRMIDDIKGSDDVEEAFVEIIGRPSNSEYPEDENFLQFLRTLKAESPRGTNILSLRNSPSLLLFKNYRKIDPEREREIFDELQKVFEKYGLDKKKVKDLSKDDIPTPDPAKSDIYKKH